jgi:hypothetical protein
MHNEYVPPFLALSLSLSRPLFSPRLRSRTFGRSAASPLTRWPSHIFHPELLDAANGAKCYLDRTRER